MENMATHFETYCVRVLYYYKLTGEVHRSKSTSVLKLHSRNLERINWAN